MLVDNDEDIHIHTSLRIHPLGALDLFFGRGVRPGPRHPNPGLNQKFANVYPGVNQISVSIHYIYVAPNHIWVIFSAYKQSIIISKDPINNKRLLRHHLRECTREPTQYTYITTFFSNCIPCNIPNFRKKIPWTIPNIPKKTPSWAAPTHIASQLKSPKPPSPGNQPAWAYPSLQTHINDKSTVTCISYVT